MLLPASLLDTHGIWAYMALLNAAGKRGGSVLCIVSG